MNRTKKLVSLGLCALLMLQMILIAGPARVYAETVTELAKYGASANAVIDQTAANQKVHYPRNHQGGGAAAYNVKAGNGSERQAYYKFDLPDPSKLAEANKIYLSVKGKSNAGQGTLYFTVAGVTYNGWSSDLTKQGADVTSAVYSGITPPLLAWINAPVKYNSQTADAALRYEKRDPSYQAIEIAAAGCKTNADPASSCSFATTDAKDDEYRIDVTDFVKQYGVSGAVSFLIRAAEKTQTNASTIYNSYNTDAAFNGQFGSTDKKPALILQKVEGPGPNLPYTVPPANVTASADDGNVPQNVVDNNRYTRWSAQNMAGEPHQWIQLDLGAVKPVGYLGIAFNAGTNRKSFFDILVSGDGAAWTTVLQNQESSGTSDQVELVDLRSQNISARYVRYLGHGNSAPNSKDWNSLTAFQIYPPAEDGSAALVPVPYIEPPKPPAEPNTIPGLFHADGTPYIPYEPNRNPSKTWNIVTDFGAKPDDPDFDNTPVINNAISDPRVAAGHEIFFPDGVYHLKSTMSGDALSNFQVKSNVNLRGESEQGTILLSYFNGNNGSTRVIKAFGKKELLISNFTIKSIFESKLNEPGADGQPDYAYSVNTNTANPKIGGFGNGIYIDQTGNIGSNKIVIEHVTVEHFQRMGIRVSRSQEITIRNSTFKNATDVGAGGAGYGIAVQGDTTKVNHFGEPIDVYFNIVENNNFLGPYIRHGVIIQHFAHNNLITKNYANGTLLDSIDLHGENEYLNEISYNVIENVPKEAIGVGNTGGTPPNTNHSASGPKNYIHHNTLKHNRDGIMVYMGSPDTIIEENEIIATTDYNMFSGTNGVNNAVNTVQDGVGIKLHNAPGTIVKNNVIRGNTASNYWGILLAHHNGDSGQSGLGAGDPENVQLIGNTVTGNAYGLNIEAGRNITVLGNTIKDNLGTNLNLNIPLDNTDLAITDLRSLKVMDGTASLDLTPAFAPGTTEYSLEVGNSVSSLLIQASPENSRSVIKMNGDVQSEGTGFAINDLQVGSNPIEIEVSADNETKKKTYRLAVNKLQPDGKPGDPNEPPVSPKPGKRSSNSGGGSGAVQAGDAAASDQSGSKNDQAVQLAAEVKTIDGKQTAQATVDGDVIDNALKNSGSGILRVAINADTAADRTIAILSNSALQKMMTDKSIKSLSIETSLGSYELPMKQIDVQDLAAKLGTTADAVTLEVTISKNVSAAEKAKASGQKVLGAVEFTVTVNSVFGKSMELSAFTQFVKRTVMAEGALNASNLAAVRVETDKGNSVYQPVPFTVSGSKAALYSRTNSTYLLLENNVAFTDTQNHWAKADIERMANKYIVQGVSKDAFQPDQAVSRAEFAVLITRTLGLSPTGSSKIKWSDVRPDDWFEGQVYAAAEVGIITGYDDQTFGPNQPISRQEMAVMIYRAMKFAGFDDSSKTAQAVAFADENLIPSWAKEAVAIMAGNGIVDGVASGKYDPAATATRAQSAVILNRMLAKAQFNN
ncbi:S-layer homology domain-containing protein [Paenibacillus piri]|uniref:Uncharacterized protein n=1 Tax=Paenibacillus piri TaxID=2547395 RepID=A0A4R5KZC6_9BACL|nr:S-layer homology domain-containing protein [Paenibacillus piri]TDG00528.1 hypothetical protein E1757_02530 [Paenibacillus piri]